MTLYPLHVPRTFTSPLFLYQSRKDRRPSTNNLPEEKDPWSNPVTIQLATSIELGTRNKKVRLNSMVDHVELKSTFLRGIVNNIRPDDRC